MSGQVRRAMVLALALAALAAWMVPAESACCGASAAKRQDTYWVTLIRDHTGDLTVQAIKAMEYKDQEKEILAGLKAGYDTAVEAWLAEKKEAAANGKDFRKPKPKRQLQQYKRIAGKEKAFAEAERLQKKAGAGSSSSG